MKTLEQETSATVWQCPVCNQDFGATDELTEHIRTTHPDYILSLSVPYQEAIKAYGNDNIKASISDMDSEPEKPEGYDLIEGSCQSIILNVIPTVATEATATSFAGLGDTIPIAKVCVYKKQTMLSKAGISVPMKVVIGLGIVALVVFGVMQLTKKRKK